MINHIRNIGSIHIYAKHEVVKPDVVDDMMLLPTTRERKLNSGGEIPNSNEEINSGAELPNCNEGVSSGVGEPFTKLGGESNERPEMGRTSDACAESGEQIFESRGYIDTYNSLSNEEVLRADSEDEEVRNIKA
ncbi:hypothetical protein PVK06_024985 [Gossypium arboreum]|uniref:Uncharacterized protein n=1 Tax=Gossypium arboreum TaxID=29729 RepID=A0ABR0PFK5_GOSAR|nr:hypothetical protein PVK06_024985 [Gossypium arboreum]